MGSTVTPAETSRLFKPIKLGNHELQHRVSLAALTRYRNDDDHVPLDMMRQYYADRASAPGTLIVSEASAISEAEAGEPNNASMATPAQAAAWKEIIKGVHAKGSVFFQQLYAMGSSAKPEYIGPRGFEYRDASAVKIPGRDVAPREMTVAEIEQTIDDFVAAAKRAVFDAGADGVEIHAAHGYLLDHFLTPSLNQRTDEWGGSTAKSCRLTLEVVRRVAEAVGIEKVAVRLSPFATYQGGGKGSGLASRKIYGYLITELRKQTAGKLAYLSLVEAAGDPMAIVLGGDYDPTLSLDFALEAWDNASPVVVAGAYTPESALVAADNVYARWDVLVAFGRRFLANPDLVYRVGHGVPLNKYDRTTFYIPKAPQGYNDYPFSQEYLQSIGSK